MAKQNVGQFGFAAGELDPKMRGRLDLPYYYNGGERVSNFIPELQGAARFRNGTRQVLNIPTDSNVKLIPFIFNDEQAYILEFREGKFRVYQDGAPIKYVEAADIIAVEKRTDKYVLHVDGTAGATAFHADNDVYIFGLTAAGYTELNDLSWEISNVTTSTYNASYIEFEIDYPGNTADGPTAVSIGQVDSLFTQASSIATSIDLTTLDYVQYADTIYISSGAQKIVKIVRGGATTWTVSLITYTGTAFATANNYPEAIALYESRKFLGGTTTDPGTFWGSLPNDFEDFTTGATATDAVEFDIAADLNPIRYLKATKDFLIAMTLGGAYRISGASELEAIAPTSISVRPLHYTGVAKVRPVKIDNDILFVELGRRKIRQIQYSFDRDSYEPVDLTKLASHITRGGISTLAYASGDPNLVLAIRNQTTDTSSGDNLGGELIAMTYDKQEGIAAWCRLPTREGDATVDVETIPQANGPDQIWVISRRLINGSYVLFTEYFIDQVEFPIYEQYFTDDEAETADANAYDRALLEAQRQSIHVDSSLTYDGSTVYADTGNPALTFTDNGDGTYTVTCGSSIFFSTLVGREIWAKNGAGKLRIDTYNSGTEVEGEVLVPFDDTTGAAAGQWYLTANQFLGLNYLEGETVQVITDGARHPDEVVSGGVINLDYQTAVIHAGLPYKGILKTMNVEAGGVLGPSVGKDKIVNRSTVKFLNTGGAKYGTNLYKAEEIIFRNAQNRLDRAAPLFSGDKEIVFKDSHSTEKFIYILQENGLPCTVTALNTFADTADD